MFVISKKSNSPAVVYLLSLVDHCKSFAAEADVSAGDVSDVSVVDDLQTRLSSEVVEVRDELLTSRKQLVGVGAEARSGLAVLRVGEK